MGSDVRRDGAVGLASVMREVTRAMRVHGGPDARGPAPWDFSTNANAAGPCPLALAAVRDADPTRYPDPHYTALRERLGDFHGVDRDRVLIAASASEFIQRITAVSARLSPGTVAVPRHAYGDYAAAARAWGRELVDEGDPAATLRWCCEPSSPLGQGVEATAPFVAFTVLDAAYAALRLEGESAWRVEHRRSVFELHTPNKALGLTGIRGAYAIAPADTTAAPWIAAMQDAAPSWPVGAHALAMLAAWTSAPVQAWVAESRELLRGWKRSQMAMLEAAGVELVPSVVNFFCARLPAAIDLRVLRERGIAVRDASSFGLPGLVRLSVQPPAAQRALEQALDAMMRS